MQANEANLNEFLTQTKTQFVIPIYQRNYDWTTKECDLLFNNIVEVAKNDLGVESSHFIGSIVYMKSNSYDTSKKIKKFMIIDGQQRLTTIMILFLALYKFAKENDYEEAEEIYNEILINKYHGSDENSKLKLRQTDDNHKIYQHLVDNLSIMNIEYSNISENFNYFCSKIKEKNFSLIKNGLARLRFVEISLEYGKDDPQKIFESLNSTGLELSSADLIRNYILMSLEHDKQVTIYEKYWKIIENNCFKEINNEQLISLFIRDYIIIKNKRIPNISKVYVEFKTTFSNKNKDFYENTLNELRTYSYLYYKIINPSKEQNLNIRNELENIELLNSTVSYAFILPVYNDFENRKIINDKTFVKILRLIQSYIWRRLISNYSSASLKNTFMVLYHEIDENDYYNSIERAFFKSKGATFKFPTDKDIEEALLHKDIYSLQTKNIKYFLSNLENYNNREKVNPDQLTIEHIFPQNPESQWEEDIGSEDYSEFQEKYLHTLANLTYSGNNGSLKNYSFIKKKYLNEEGKRQGYMFSNLWLNEYLKTIDIWNKQTYLERFSILYKRFIEVWPYPSKENDIGSVKKEYKVFLMKELKTLLPQLIKN